VKTIGLVGGMSWESTAEYYRIINETTKQRAGGFHSAKIILYSVDFEEIERLQRAGDWDGLTAIMIDAAKRVERGGADVLLICANTMHRMAVEVQSKIVIPLLHIADVTAAKVRSLSISKVGLLGTRYTMEQDFYKGRLARKHGLEVLVPGKDDRDIIHDILYNELCLGEVREASINAFKQIIAGLVGQGAQGVILGCTEIPLIVKQKDYDIPLFDTTAIHAEAAVDYALQG